ncbi:MAG: imidazole glycerol phosphate synthase subunit HisH [Clostridia bacterium]|nr:imidazole glycerol phosphate synthase subunit HisH [Clostridia bacterium]
MIAIIDYGVGNLFSLASSLASLGFDAVVTGDPAVIRSADRLILPGVGAFGDAADKLRETGLDELIRDEVKKGKELLGICLGMQLLFDKSSEYGVHAGLGLLKGEVVPLEGMIDPSLKIPHIGWNALTFVKPECRLFRSIREGDFVYFVHSFHAVGCEDSLSATAEYGIPVTAVVSKDNVFGCQFHPEKSGKVGLAILAAFAEGVTK